MALKDPFAAYNARDSVEAHFVCGLIQDAGIDAFVIDDVSNLGLSGWTGPMPELHKPQVWVERADAEPVKSILDEYEQRVSERRARQGQDRDDVVSITVRCESCDQTASFPASLRGNVELCPNCGSYVDVDDRTDEDEWWLTDGEAEPEES